MINSMLAFKVSKPRKFEGNPFSTQPNPTYHDTSKRNKKIPVRFNPSGFNTVSTSVGILSSCTPVLLGGL